MMIQTTNGQIIAAAEALSKLAQTKMSGALALKVLRIVRVINPEAESIDAIRQAVLDRCVARDDDGNPLAEVDAQNRPVPNRVVLRDAESYRREITELLAGETTLELPTLQEEEMESLKDLEPATLLALGPLLVRPDI
jgi:hypothetical protein